MRNPLQNYHQNGWCRFDHDNRLMAWITQILPAARATVSAPENARWHRCEGTWFTGVNVLPNDCDAALEDGSPLACDAVDFINYSLGLRDFCWDRGQISVCYPGYPRPKEGEGEAAFAYRRDRDAAHLDGLLPEGPQKRRHMREFHGFILGIPLVEFDRGASPFVVWEGSHEIIREAFARRFEGINPASWGDEDVTETYQQVRRQVFEQCSRVEVFMQPGECYLAHRLLIHGMAPWQEGASAGPDGRMSCYFRPPNLTAQQWLSNP